MAGKAARELLVSIDPRSRASLQFQIYSGIRHSILSGTLQPEARIPSSRALAADLSVSRTTTLLAYEQLQAEGYLSARRGSGSFVASELPDDVLRARAVRRPVSIHRHPPLSRRGRALAATPPAAVRVGGPPRPFRIGVPAVDRFPVKLWAQLVGRRWRSIGVSQLDYGEAAGLRALREAIACHVSSARGTRCSPDQIVGTAGAQRAVGFVASLLPAAGDRAWTEDPGYPGARRALLRAEARIVPVPVDADGLVVSAGARQAGDARLAIVTPSHQFPLGVPMSLPRRLALLEWARA